jgi:hypothetical protein
MSPRIAEEFQDLFRKVLRTLHINPDQIYHLYISLNIYCFHGNLLQKLITQTINDIKFSSLLEQPIYLQTQLCTLISTSNESGLIIDVGYNETRIVPLFSSRIIQAAVKIVPIGAKHVLITLRQIIIDNNPLLICSKELEDITVLEDILVRICFCDPKVSDEQDRVNKVKYNPPSPWPLKPETTTPLKPAKRSRATSLIEAILPTPKSRARAFTTVAATSTPKKRGVIAQPTVTYYCKDDVRISLPLPARTLALEVLLRQNAEGESIVNAIMESVSACNRDCRKAVINNLVFCGGGSMYTGFTHRVCSELWHAVTANTQDRSQRNLYDKMRVYRNKTLPSTISSWNGASIIATKFSGTFLKTASPSTPTKQT